jgi:hypothetical protein
VSDPELSVIFSATADGGIRVRTREDPLVDFVLHDEGYLYDLSIRVWTGRMECSRTAVQAYLATLSSSIRDPDGTGRCWGRTREEIDALRKGVGRTAADRCRDLAAALGRLLWAGGAQTVDTACACWQARAFVGHCKLAGGDAGVGEAVGNLLPRLEAHAFKHGPDLSGTPARADDGALSVALHEAIDRLLDLAGRPDPETVAAAAASSSPAGPEAEPLATVLLQRRRFADHLVRAATACDRSALVLKTSPGGVPEREKACRQAREAVEDARQALKEAHLSAFEQARIGFLLDACFVDPDDCFVDPDDPSRMMIAANLIRYWKSWLDGRLDPLATVSWPAADDLCGLHCQLGACLSWLENFSRSDTGSSPVLDPVNIRRAIESALELAYAARRLLDRTHTGSDALVDLEQAARDTHAVLMPEGKLASLPAVRERMLRCLGHLYETWAEVARAHPDLVRAQGGAPAAAGQAGEPAPAGEATPDDEVRGLVREAVRFRDDSKAWLKECDRDGDGSWWIPTEIHVHWDQDRCNLRHHLENFQARCGFRLLGTKLDNLGGILMPVDRQPRAGLVCIGIFPLDRSVAVVSRAVDDLVVAVQLAGAATPERPADAPGLGPLVALLGKLERKFGELAAGHAVVGAPDQGGLRELRELIGAASLALEQMPARMPRADGLGSHLAQAGQIFAGPEPFGDGLPVGMVYRTCQVSVGCWQRWIAGDPQPIIMTEGERDVTGLACEVLGAACWLGQADPGHPALRVLVAGVARLDTMDPASAGATADLRRCLESVLEDRRSLADARFDLVASVEALARTWKDRKAVQRAPWALADAFGDLATRLALLEHSLAEHDPHESVTAALLGEVQASYYACRQAIKDPCLTDREREVVIGWMERSDLAGGRSLDGMARRAAAGRAHMARVLSCRWYRYLAGKEQSPLQFSDGGDPVLRGIDLAGELAWLRYAFLLGLSPAAAGVGNARRMLGEVAGEHRHDADLVLATLPGEGAGTWGMDAAALDRGQGTVVGWVNAALLAEARRAEGAGTEPAAEVAPGTAAGSVEDVLVRFHAQCAGWMGTVYQDARKQLWIPRDVHAAWCQRMSDARDEVETRMTGERKAAALGHLARVSFALAPAGRWPPTPPWTDGCVCIGTMDLARMVERLGVFLGMPERPPGDAPGADGKPAADADQEPAPVAREEATASPSDGAAGPAAAEAPAPVTTAPDDGGIRDLVAQAASFRVASCAWLARCSGSDSGTWSVPLEFHEEWRESCDTFAQQAEACWKDLAGSSPEKAALRVVLGRTGDLGDWVLAPSDLDSPAAGMVPLGSCRLADSVAALAQAVTDLERLVRMRDDPEIRAGQAIAAAAARAAPPARGEPPPGAGAEDAMAPAGRMETPALQGVAFCASPCWKPLDFIHIDDARTLVDSRGQPIRLPEGIADRALRRASAEVRAVAGEGVLRVAGTQLTGLVRTAVVGAARRATGRRATGTEVGRFLASPEGEALLQAVASVLIEAAPLGARAGDLQHALAHELRVGALAGLGDELAGMLLGPVLATMQGLLAGGGDEADGGASGSPGAARPEVARGGTQEAPGEAGEEVEERLQEAAPGGLEARP